jgi:hypothetical protein
MPRRRTRGILSERCLMLSVAGQHALVSLLQNKGQAAVAELVRTQNRSALEQAGFSQVDAGALLHTAADAGVDAAFNLAPTMKLFGGTPSGQVGTALAVAQAAGQRSAGSLSPMTAVMGGSPANPTAVALAPFVQHSNDEISNAFKDNYVSFAKGYADALATETGKTLGVSARTIRALKRNLQNLVVEVAKPYQDGDFTELQQDPHMTTHAMRFHAATLVAHPEVSAAMGLDSTSAQRALVSATAPKPAAAQAPSSTLLLVIKSQPDVERGPRPTSVSELISNVVPGVANPNSDTRFGFSDVDNAAHRATIHAALSTIQFALLSNNDFEVALGRAFDRPSSTLADAVLSPKSDDDRIVYFAAQAAQLATVVSFAGLGIVDADNGKDGTKHFDRIQGSLITNDPAAVSKNLEAIKLGLVVLGRLDARLLGSS